MHLICFAYYYLELLYGPREVALVCPEHKHTIMLQITQGACALTLAQDKSACASLEQKTLGTLVQKLVNKNLTFQKNNYIM